jgi:hypothetical protein
VALPLAGRGIAVHGIELSSHMAERMLAKPGAGAVSGDGRRYDCHPRAGDVPLGVPRANAIMNVTAQDDQLAVFATAAAHLEPGGCFVVEVEVPQLRGVPPGDRVGVHSQPRSCRDRDLR